MSLRDGCQWRPQYATPSGGLQRGVGWLKCSAGKSVGTAPRVRHHAGMNEPLTIDRLLEPVAGVLGQESARRLVELRADGRAAERIGRLAGKANEGTLTPAEREEYEACVQVTDIIAVLQAKARKLLRAPA